ncbi:restriction endonuclease subunit S [Lawsonella clevelandensis]|uniref:restriction endonuclease subunit S n=1 Tax=Lawsonella clevelandensis TaxID=1528099 RepID=UPI0023F1FED4|nr:restriction endonuclease subunit S [Lawsonella clevelandensis]
MHSRNVPALRLEGFDGAWDAKPFSEMVERSTLMPAEPSLPRVEYEDIVSGAGVLNKNLRFKESIKTGIYFQPGDVLYGKLRPYLKNWLLATFEGLAVGDFWVLRPENTDSRYLYSLIQTNAFVDVASVSSGSKMPRADWRLVSGAAFNTPPTLEEQQAIGAIFTNLDDAINQHTKKHQALQQAKTALMQRMFPQEGQTVPELRLEGFDGEWESTTVDAVANVVGGGTPSTSNPSFWDGDIDWYSPNEVGSDIVAKPSNRRITSEGLHASSAQLLPAHRTILYTSRASIGHTAILEHPATTNQGFQSLVLRSGMDTHFVYSLTPLITRKAIKIASGSTFLEISAKALGSIEIPIPPTLEEQQAIGAVFTRLDTLIAAEAKYIESLKQTKTALLQQMFI